MIENCMSTPDVVGGFNAPTKKHRRLKPDVKKKQQQKKTTEKLGREVEDRVEDPVFKGGGLVP